MNKIKVGIIGLGIRGKIYAETLAKGWIEKAELTSVCDTDERQLEWANVRLNGSVKKHLNADELISSGEADGVIIVTPYYSHPSIVIKALKENLHVFMGTPTGIYTERIEEMAAEAGKSEKTLGILLNRTDMKYKKARQMIESGAIGRLRSVNWIITDHKHPLRHYNSDSWNSTWGREGWGVLINKSVHYLDIMQWICGVPEKVCASGNAKYHGTDMIDDVSAYFEYENGAKGTFIAFSGNEPGMNRLEIKGRLGELVIEDGRLLLHRLKADCGADYPWFAKHAEGPEKYETIEIMPGAEEELGGLLIADWIKAIAEKKPHLSPGENGIKSLELINAMYLSSWTGMTVTLPVREDLYCKKLKEKM